MSTQNTFVVWPFPAQPKCKAVLQRGLYTHQCSRKATRNGYCAYHYNRRDDKANEGTP